MTELKVPFAFNEGQVLFSPEFAERGRRYFCPACNDEVILKKGDVKVAHFAHKVSDTCSQETIIHKTAKHLVHKAVSDWKSGKASSPLIRRQCKICSTSIDQSLPDRVTSAQVECRLPDQFVADVALMVDEQPAAAIEIRVFHAVDEVKAATMSIPFIELDGNEVLEHLALWTPLVDNFKPFACQTCADTLKEFNAKVSEIAAERRISIPTSYYRYSFCQCWKCKKMTLVFTWPGQQEGIIPAGQPRPGVIQYRSSKMAGAKYWANVCMHCSALQGDFFLYNEPDGPFFAFECGADAPEEFHQDLKKLAQYAKYAQLI
ncbi:MAG: competence protein CoiA family protein [Candidatus Kryptoniota bacterium]